MATIKSQLLVDAERANFANALTKAMKEEDSDGVAKAFSDFFKTVESGILKQAEDFDIATADKALYAQRGLRVLSNAEEKYFKGFISAAKSVDAQKALTDFSEVLPESEVNAVFEDMKQAHPLLNAVDFTDTAALTKFILDTSTAQKALWGELNTAITKELEGSVKLVELTLGKLTAFMFISNDMLDLGPVWVEKYVRTILAEACSSGCEYGILRGTGIKGEPVGMVRNISETASVNQSTGYPEKDVVTVTDFLPESYGELLAKLSVDEAGKSRNVPEVMLVVNPTDYFQKVMSATTLLLPSGGYARDVFPYPTKVYTSTEVDSGKAVLGISKKYFFGIGVGTEHGKITADDSVKFLEDVRTFKVKMYGTGRAYDNNCFLYLDISGLKSIQYPILQSAATPAAG